MIVKVLERSGEQMRIHSTGNAIKGTLTYSFEVVTHCGRRVNGWDETFKLFSDALRFARSYGWKVLIEK